MTAIDADLARVGGVLLEDRVLRRVIKAHRKLPGLGLQVPHARAYVVPAADLARLVEADELPLPAAALPPRAIVFSGDREAIEAGDAKALTHAWRALFHGHVHEAFDARRMTPAAVRERVNRIGQTEFDEIRQVLRQEDLLLPPVSDASTYAEFVALYLELAHFAPRALSRTFPTLAGRHVETVIALDLDAAALLAASRPAAAPETPALDEPEPEPPIIETPAVVRDPGARAAASKARVKGNRVRAAILAIRAGDRDGARGDLDALGARLATAVGSDAPAATWTAALLPLVEAAAGQRVLRFTPAARLLYDVQAACVVAEREVRVVDTGGWIFSRGKRPIVRTLPATREVRVARHLHAAEKKLDQIALVDSARERLAEAVHDIVQRGDANVRTVLRPKLEQALDAVELRPRHLPERVAQKKLVDELLDQAVAVGRLSIGNLRDAISHNDLKMPDLRLDELRTGDELLRCDDALSYSLDGVYRRGEGYLRFLQRLSSTLFGTRIGRFLTLYLILPLLGSYTVLAGLDHTVRPILHHATGAHIPEVASWSAVLGGAVFLFLLLHVALVRRLVARALSVIGRALWSGTVGALRWGWRHPSFRAVLRSRPVRWLVLPALPALVIVLFGAQLFWFVRWPVALAVFALFALGMNSRAGRRAWEIATDALVRSSRHVAARILPGLVKYTLDLFAELIELLDRGIYRVDEWLRFKAGQSKLTLYVKGAIGTVWGFATYFVRLYVNLFIEPVVNPIKHFPVVTVAAKLTLTMSPAMLSALTGPFSSVLGPTLGASFAAFTVFVVPGLAGFLVWEFKENWKLYRRTRAETIGAVAFGHHGETMVAFLRPGFHSGTIPKLFTKVRRAAWKGDERAVAKHKEALHHVVEAIDKFTDRELVSLLNEASAFRASDIAVAGVDIASNRVQLELVCPSVGQEVARISIEQQSGWIVAGIAAKGWFGKLDLEQRRILEIALAGFYKQCGVEIVREQIEAVTGAAPYDISDEGLLVWPGQGYDTEALYDLRSPFPMPQRRGAAFDGTLPSLAGKHAIYARETLRWSVWTNVWEQLGRDEEPMQIVVGPSLIGEPALHPASPAAVSVIELPRAG